MGRRHGADGARGDQIGQIRRRRQRGSSGRVRRTEAEAATESSRREQPEGQVAESTNKKCNITVRYVQVERKKKSKEINTLKTSLSLECIQK